MAIFFMFWLCMNMQINNQNNISFTSTPIHRVNIRNAKTGELIPAIFSKLDRNSNIDRSAITIIHNSWSCPTAKEICFYFLETHFPDDFWAIELIRDKNLSKKIVGLAQTNIEQCSKIFDLKYLSTKPSLSNKSKEKRVVKNIGEVLVGSIVNQAKHKDADYIHVASLIKAIPFYEKIIKNASFKPENCHLTKMQRVFFIEKKDFNKYLNHLADEYKINFSA